MPKSIDLASLEPIARAKREWQRELAWLRHEKRRANKNNRPTRLKQPTAECPTSPTENSVPEGPSAPQDKDSTSVCSARKKIRRWAEIATLEEVTEVLSSETEVTKEEEQGDVRAKSRKGEKLRKRYYRKEQREKLEKMENKISEALRSFSAFSPYVVALKEQLEVLATTARRKLNPFYAVSFADVSSNIFVLDST